MLKESKWFLLLISKQSIMSSRYTSFKEDEETPSSLKYIMENLKKKKTKRKLCANLQGFCKADSPSWCGHLIHRGSSSASPVYLFSSSVHFCVWPDLWLPLSHPFCLACSLAFCQNPFCSWTYKKEKKKQVVTRCACSSNEEHSFVDF